MTQSPLHTSASIPTSPQVKWRVLLADDEPVQRMLIGRMLTRAGYDVITAEDGQQALKHMQDGNIALLVTDWEMPNLDGIGLCRAVRSMQLPHYTYTIVVTARDAVEHVVMGLQSGADDYLTKPVTEPELLARLNTGKRLVEMERSLRAANQENHRLSITDALTGVFNRRYLMDQLQRELERSQRYGHPLSIFLCDVDHFKRINDTHGHQCGDETLIEFARSLHGCLRDSDWVARYGGEEFVVVLPETPLSAAGHVAERCRATLAQAPLRIGSRELSITASFGISGWEQGVPPTGKVDRLIAAADAGVYASKAAGRNHATIQLTEDTPGP